MPIGGINSITRALVTKESSTNSHVIFAEGMGLSEVLKIPGVDTTKTYSNHIL